MKLKSDRRFLYLTDSYPYPSIKNGGEVISENNLITIQKLKNTSVFIYSLKTKATIWTKLLKLSYSFFGFYYPLTPFRIKCILEKAESIGATDVFIDNSRYGLLAKYFHRIPNIRIFTFFHNAESDYFSTKSKGSYLTALIVRSLELAEESALKYSKKCAFISDVDQAKLTGVKNNDSIIPVSIKDRFSKEKVAGSCGESFILFFGSAFFANVEGITWFVENVMCNLKLKLIVVGRGFDAYANVLERDNVEVIGSVDDPSYYFYNALCVVAPIFSGSGMKVKTAEAMMYGKPILGSDKAFSNYNNLSQYMFVCNSASDYLCVLNNSSSLPKFSSEVRAIYLANYESSVVSDKLRFFLDND